MPASVSFRTECLDLVAMWLIAFELITEFAWLLAYDRYFSKE